MTYLEQRRSFLKLSTMGAIMTALTSTGCVSSIQKSEDRRQRSEAGITLTRDGLPVRHLAASDKHVRLVALAGTMSNTQQVERGLATLRAMGLILDNVDCVFRRQSRFAGSEAARLADLNDLAKPSVALPDLILATRGGYGSMRLLRSLDYQALCPRLNTAGTLLMGHSDITAVQLALLAKGGTLSCSGPMLYSDFARTPLSAFTLEWFGRVLSQPSFELHVPSPDCPAIQTTGTLWGGNLSVLTSLVGSEYLPRIEGGILFLEEVNQHVYSIERMLLQLYDAGILSQQSAILLGAFSATPPDPYDPAGYTLQHVIDYFQARLNIPILTKLPIGHIPDMVPLPIGATARLSSDQTGYTLAVSHYPHPFQPHTA